MDLEVPRADRHVDAVPSPPAASRDCATADSETPNNRRTRRSGGRARSSSSRSGAVSSTRGQSSCSSRGGPGSATATASRLEDDRRSGPDESHRTPPRPGASPACDAVREIGVRPPQALGDAARAALDLPRAPRRRRARRPVAARAARSCGRHVSGRDRPRRRAGRREPFTQRSLEIGRLVADDGDPRGVDPEPRAATPRGTGRFGRAGRRGRARSPTRRSPPPYSGAPTGRRDEDHARLAGPGRARACRGP